MELELQKRQSEYMNKELKINNDYDELKINIKRYIEDMKKLKIEKERINFYAKDLEGQSKVIHKHNIIMEKAKISLEQMRAEIDIKESLLRTEKGRIESSQKDVTIREKALTNLNRKYKQDNILDKDSSIKHVKLISNELTEKTPTRKVNDKVRSCRTRTSKPLHFDANDFIEKLEKSFGKEPDFDNYIASEKTRLTKLREHKKTQVHSTDTKNKRSMRISEFGTESQSRIKHKPKYTNLYKSFANDI